MEGRVGGQRGAYGGVVSHLLRREAFGDVRTRSLVQESREGGGGRVSKHGRGDARGRVQRGIPEEGVVISSKSAREKSKGDFSQSDDGGGGGGGDDDDDVLGGGSEFMGFLRSASQAASQASKSVISSVSSDHHSSVAPAVHGGSSRQTRGSTLASQSPRRGLLPDI
jgi:hypothetical protein